MLIIIGLSPLILPLIVFKFENGAEFESACAKNVLGFSLLASKNDLISWNLEQLIQDLRLRKQIIEKKISFGIFGHLIAKSYVEK